MSNREQNQPERRFPIQDGATTVGDRRIRVRGFTVPWSVGEAAWRVYHARYGNDQSCERIAERGGFGIGELLWLLAGAPDDRESDLLSIGSRNQ